MGYDILAGTSGMITELGGDAQKAARMAAQHVQNSARMDATLEEIKRMGAIGGYEGTPLESPEAKAAAGAGELVGGLITPIPGVGVIGEKVGEAAVAPKFVTAAERAEIEAKALEAAKRQKLPIVTKMAEAAGGSAGAYMAKPLGYPAMVGAGLVGRDIGKQFANRFVGESNISHLAKNFENIAQIDRVIEAANENLPRLQEALAEAEGVNAVNLRNRINAETRRLENAQIVRNAIDEQFKKALTPSYKEAALKAGVLGATIGGGTEAIGGAPGESAAPAAATGFALGAGLGTVAKPVSDITGKINDSARRFMGRRELGLPEEPPVSKGAGAPESGVQPSDGVSPVTSAPSPSSGGAVTPQAVPVSLAQHPNAGNENAKPMHGRYSVSKNDVTGIEHPTEKDILGMNPDEVSQADRALRGRESPLLNVHNFKEGSEIKSIGYGDGHAVVEFKEPTRMRGFETYVYKATPEEVDFIINSSNPAKAFRDTIRTNNPQGAINKSHLKELRKAANGYQFPEGVTTTKTGPLTSAPAPSTKQPLAATPAPTEQRPEVAKETLPLEKKQPETKEEWDQWLKERSQIQTPDKAEMENAPEVALRNLQENLAKSRAELVEQLNNINNRLEQMSVNETQAPTMDEINRRVEMEKRKADVEEAIQKNDEVTEFHKQLADRFTPSSEGLNPLREQLATEAQKASQEAAKRTQQEADAANKQAMDKENYASDLVNEIAQKEGVPYSSVVRTRQFSKDIDTWIDYLEKRWLPPEKQGPPEFVGPQKVTQEEIATGKARQNYSVDELNRRTLKIAQQFKEMGIPLNEETQKAIRALANAQTPEEYNFLKKMVQDQFLPPKAKGSSKASPLKSFGELESGKYPSNPTEEGGAAAVKPTEPPPQPVPAAQKPTEKVVPAEEPPVTPKAEEKPVKGTEKAKSQAMLDAETLLQQAKDLGIDVPKGQEFLIRNQSGVIGADLTTKLAEQVKAKSAEAASVEEATKKKVNETSSVVPPATETALIPESAKTEQPKPLAASPEVKATKPLETIKPEDVTVKRSKDFSTTGNYEVSDGENTVKIYRDPESGWWYRAQAEGETQKHFTELNMGFKKDEAVAKAKDMLGEMGEGKPLAVAEKPTEIRDLESMPKSVRDFLSKHTDKVEEVSNEAAGGNGYWIYLKEGWVNKDMGSRTINENTAAEVIRAFKDFVRPASATETPSSPFEKMVSGAEDAGLLFEQANAEKKKGLEVEPSTWYSVFTNKDKNVKIAISGDTLFIDGKGRVNRSYETKPNAFLIAKIITDPKARNKGLASETLKNFIKLADESGVTLTLEPAEIKVKGEKGLTYPKLVDWYKRNGFVPKSEESGTRIMVRKPVKPIEGKFPEPESD